MATASPQFIEPSQPRLAPALTVDGSESLTITNFRNQLPEPSSVKSRLAFVRAGRNAGVALDDDSLHAIARSLTHPEIAASTVRHNLLTEEVVGPASLTTFNGFVLLTELLPILQPRAGGAAREVDPPEVSGILDENNVPEAMLTLTFRDADHLHAQLRQTVRQTRTMGRDYSASILSKRVSRPVLVHATRICFADGDESFIVNVVRDGITRVVSSWAVLKPELDVDELADFITDKLLASRKGRAGATTETASRARGRHAYEQELRAQFIKGTAGPEPTEDAIRIGQSLTLPAQVLVNLTQSGERSVNSDEQFDDAVQALVASVHGEFKPWDQSAADSAAILRALPRAVHAGKLERNLAEMAARCYPDRMQEVFGADAPSAALWRGVYLISHFSHPTRFKAIKRHLRELLGVSSIKNRTYVSHLMTLVDLPWRNKKANTERQARRAWSNGGPVPSECLNQEWDPTPTADFTTLVPRALSGDKNAQYTLQVAGGIALITDKLLMSNTGSSFAAGLVPFRADVDDVITGLGRSQAGLWLLARAANAFHEDRKAINSFTEKEVLLAPSLAQNAYTVPRINLLKPSEIRVDNNGQPEALTPHDVVYVSDPDRAREAKREKDERDSAGKGKTATPIEQARKLRKQIKASLMDAGRDLGEVRKLAGTNSAVGSALGDTDQWRQIDDIVREVQQEIYLCKPIQDGLFSFDSDGMDENDEDDEV